MSKITKDTILSELLEDQEAIKILAKCKLPCLSCPFARFEAGTLKLGEVCKMYNIDLEDLLLKLNKL